MSYEMIAALMFSTMLLMMMTGQRVFAVIGFVAVFSALMLWGTGGERMLPRAVIRSWPQVTLTRSPSTPTAVTCACV